MPHFVLATITGKDKPGITSALTGILAQSGVTIADIGQSVIHDLLSLSILFQIEDEYDRTTIKDLLFGATELGMKLEFQVFGAHELKDRHTPKAFRYVITVLADVIPATSLHEVTQAVSKRGMNIDEIQKIGEGEFGCLELLVSSRESIDHGPFKKELLEISKAQGVDVALQADGPFRRMKRLICFDMDSTLIQNEVIDELARAKGVYDEVSKITEEAMQGKLDFKESLRRRCALLKGLTLKEIDAVYPRIKLTPGAHELVAMLKKLGYKVALISGGFTLIADRLRKELDLDYVYANTLEIAGDALTGNVIGPIVDAQRKADLLEVIAQQERIRLEQVIAVGDGANDLLMLERAGLGVAFNAKPVVSEKADLALSAKNLKSILYLLGFSSRDLKGI
jgi:phosphoserine phosphatase